MRCLFFALVMLPLACAPQPGELSLAQQRAVERVIRNEVVAAYDFTKPNVIENMLSLYPTSGPIISASGGRVMTTRDSLEAGITTFWESAGRNMRSPRVEWTFMHIDVLAPDAAVMTATYRIPHIQPNGLKHVLGGAWTAVFRLRHGRWVIVQEHLSDDPYAS